jgi:hypothetical protein
LPKRLAYALGLNSQTYQYQHDLKPVVEMAASASEFSPEEWAVIFKSLAPFGNGNPCPNLIVEAAELIGVRASTRARFTALAKSDEADGEGSEFVNENSSKKTPSPSADNSKAYVRQNNWEFVAEDVGDATSLMDRLREKNDPVAIFLSSKMDSQETQAVEKFNRRDAHADNLLGRVLNRLNRIMEEPGLYDPERFEGIILRLQTRHLLEQDPTNRRLTELNRYLLEDAFPAEIKKLKTKPLPQVWAYEGQFWDKFTGKSFFAHWLDLEQAEVMWQVHRFLYDPPVRLPECFRLQLELRAFVPTRERSNIYRGKAFKWDYGFQIRQCVAVERDDRFPESMRMRILKK